MKIRYDLFPNRQLLVHSLTFINVYETSDESKTARIWPRRHVQSLESSGRLFSHNSHITPLSPHPSLHRRPFLTLMLLMYAAPTWPSDDGGAAGRGRRGCGCTGMRSSAARGRAAPLAAQTGFVLRGWADPQPPAPRGRGTRRRTWDRRTTSWHCSRRGRSRRWRGPSS